MAKKILLVEDSLCQAQKIRVELINNGYDVDIVHDGEEALDLAFQVKPNLIILDMYLPKMTGLEVCKRLKTDVNLRSTTVVVYSQDNQPHNITNAYEAGADCYISKSIHGSEVLVSVVETVFARQEAARKRILAGSVKNRSV